LRQVLDVLSCILHHGWRQGPLLPEFLVVLHSNVDLVLLGVHLAQVVFQQIVEAYIDVSVVIML